MKAWDLMELRKKADKIRKRIAEVENDINHQRFDPSTAKELREYVRELQAELGPIEAELKHEAARLSRERR